MKFLITTLLTLSIVTITYSQDIIIPTEGSSANITNNNQSYYIKDVNNVLNKFVGTWVFDDETHYFRITFSKKLGHDYFNFLGGSNEKYDILTSEFLYKLNNVEIYNTYTPNLPVHHGNPMMISGSSVLSDNLNKIIISYDEPSTKTKRSRSAELGLLFEFISIGNVKLHWERYSERRETIFYDSEAVDKTEFKIPSNMVLVRQ